jgi:hypothetical protein
MAAAQGSGPRRVVVPDSPHPLAPATPQTVEERRKAQAEEYGMWVATALITTPDTGANAFAPGHPVPKSHVERFPDWLIEGVNIERVQQDQGESTSDGAADAAKSTKKG